MLVEKLVDEKGDLYIKYPLINNLLNDRNWRTREDANETYAKSVIGTALTLVPDKNLTPWKDFHPFTLKPGATVLDQIKYAYNWAVGINVDVTKDSGLYKGASANEIPWFAIAKIINPQIAEEWKKEDSKLLNVNFSPGFIHGTGPDDAIESYRILHVTITPKGAYGPTFRKIASCEGTEQTCVPLLKGASSAELLVPEQDYKTRCGICALDVIKAFDNKQFSSLVTKSASSSSLSMSDNSGSTATASQQNAGAGATATDANNGAPLKSIGYANTGQEQQQQEKKKPRFKFTVLPSLSEEAEESGSANEEEEGQEQEDVEGNKKSSGIGERVKRELENLKKQQELTNKERMVEKTRNEVKDILQKYPFLYAEQKTKKFLHKKFEEDIQAYTLAILNREINSKFLADLIETKARTVPIQIEQEQQVLKRASSAELNYPYNVASMPEYLKGGSSSSLTNNDADVAQKKLGQLFRMIKGGA